jgi:hypothetical protein
MAKSRVSQGVGASKSRREQPVSEGIRRAAKRAGIDPTHDSERVTVMRGDLALAVREIQQAFDDVVSAALADEDAQHDVLVLRALRHLRSAKSMVECEMGGAL